MLLRAGAFGSSVSSSGSRCRPLRRGLLDGRPPAREKSRWPPKTQRLPTQQASANASTPMSAPVNAETLFAAALAGASLGERRH